MIKSEIIKDGTIVRTWTDQPGMELLQEDTGVQYSWEVYDINPCPHTYKEVPAKERPESADPYRRELEEKARAYDIMTGRAE